MPKALYICTKDKELDGKSIDILLETLNKRLILDNIQPRKPIKLIRNREAFLVINPNDNTKIEDFSLCQGCIIDSYTDWQVINKEIPEGTFSIIRSNRELTEIVTDAVASYSMWYYFSGDLFLASHSQRAIIHYLKSFEFNSSVIPWMLSSGILGPDYSWDKRLKLIPGHTSLILDKEHWTLNERKHEFNITPITNKYADEFIRKSLYNLFNKINLDFNKWLLPLSGGGDSRLLLVLLHNKKGLKTITWGTKQAMLDKQSDAYVAQKVASYYHVPNQYYVLDETNLPVSIILQRILIAGEGRTDTIDAYLDGFKLWKNLFEGDIQGIIRGDHGFCTRSSVWQLNDRIRWDSFKLLSDYKEYEEIKKYNIADQQFPSSFNQKSNESLKQWEIRLRQTFRFPYLMSALNDFKFSFVDVFNPMLSKSIIEAVQSCPIYADKKFFIRFNKEIGPGLDFATKYAIPADKQIMDEKGFSKYLQEYLWENNNQTLINRGLIDYTLQSLIQFKNHTSSGNIMKWLKKRFKYKIPYKLKNELIMKFRRNSINYDSFALRIFIILRMAELLQQDAVSVKDE